MADFFLNKQEVRLRSLLIFVNVYMDEFQKLEFTIIKQ